MNELRKKAQAVVDSYREDVRLAKHAINEMAVELHTIQSACEPVAFLHTVIDDDGEIDSALSFDKKSFPLEGVNGYKSIDVQALYTRPSDIYELIAEIDGLERIDFDEGGCDYPCSDGDNYRFDDVRAVLKKYRSTK